MSVPSRKTRSSKPDAIYAVLRGRIDSGHWGVGERLPTEIELASEFQCSRTSVSKALSLLSLAGLVGRRTRDGTRVLPPSAGKMLDALAFIYPNERHEGVWRTVCGFQEAAFGAQRRTLMLPTGTDFRKGAEIIGRLGEFDVKGAVLLPTFQAERDHTYYVQMLHACRLPIVLAEINLPGVLRPAAVPDGFHAGYEVTRHLLKRGLRKIGFLANFSWAPLTRDKYLGYRKAMEEAGLDGNSARVRQEAEMTPRFDDPLREPTEVAERYLAEQSDVKAVVCANDYLALGLIAAAKRRKIRIPQAMKVVGIDDFRAAAPAGLTTYRIPYEEIGRQSFALLERALAGHPEPSEIQVRGELVVRESA
ncbi:substrate-binding domain-containing protein [Verrucomicrobium sp. GAS474]|uniref:substrate-binding domain-containing protein n=1 Tax=Verrucomicrobium sp. GAS474 TaxID=1882831 RepID=UPI000B8714EC|nr:substrate-binding domain-containing protein [Verrucomicrobium sp. GAS474]